MKSFNSCLLHGVCKKIVQVHKIGGFEGTNFAPIVQIELAQNIQDVMSSTLPAESHHRPDNPVPEHEEVESNEEPQHSSYIRHQGEGRVGLYLLNNLNLVACKL